MDERTPVILTAAEKMEVLAEMRGLLETVESVLVTVSTDDIAAIPDIVRPFGMATVENESVTMAAKLPVELITMGYDAHRAMVLCTTCHSSYQFIAQEDLD